jgi:Kef-type K+ transport system membrane component KefB
MGWHGSLMPLFWILFMVFLTQLSVHLLSWLKIPSVIAYIALGILIGNGGLDFIKLPNLSWINGVGQFGLFYLMFLSGLEIDIKLLQRSSPFKEKNERRGRHPLWTSTMIFICSLALSLGLAFLMYRMDHRIQPWMMMLILSTTSLGIVLPVLKEGRLLQHLYGQLLLTAAFVADFTVMIIISIIGDMYTHGFSWDQFVIGLLLPLFYVTYYAVDYIRKSKLWKSYFQKASSSKVQAVLGLLALYGLFSDFTGAEPMLGSFLAGILLSCFQLDETNHLRKQLDTIGYGFVVPIFFVMVGVHVPLDKILSLNGMSNWILFLLVSAYAVKLLPMVWFGQSFGRKSSIAGGILLSSNLTLVIVASSIAAKYGILPHYINDALLVVALTTCIVSPILFAIISGKKLST